MVTKHDVEEGQMNCLLVEKRGMQSKSESKSIQCTNEH